MRALYDVWWEKNTTVQNLEKEMYKELWCWTRKWITNGLWNQPSPNHISTASFKATISPSWKSISFNSRIWMKCNVHDWRYPFWRNFCRMWSPSPQSLQNSAIGVLIPGWHYAGKSDSDSMAGSGAVAFVLVAGQRRLAKSFPREMLKMGGPDLLLAATASCCYFCLWRIGERQVLLFTSNNLLFRGDWSVTELLGFNFTCPVIPIVSERV